jgi:hypothetical protein
MFQLLQDAYLARKRCRTIIAIGSTILSIGGLGHLGIMDHLHRVPFTSRAVDRFHDGGKRSFAQFGADIVVSMKTLCSRASGKMAVDEA